MLLIVIGPLQKTSACLASLKVRNVSKYTDNSAVKVDILPRNNNISIIKQPHTNLILKK